VREGVERGRLMVLALLVGIIVPASSASATPPHEAAVPLGGADAGGIGIRLVDVPAAVRDPLARLYIVGRLEPGTSIRRRVEISNSTGSIANVGVYAAAARLRRGDFAFAPSHSRNELSGWTSVDQAVLRLQPRSSGLETLTIEVPKNASSGEHYAVVWAEISAPAPTAGGVTFVNRVGVRMYISIGPGGALPANFAIGALTAGRSASGGPRVVAEIRNSGRRTLEVGGYLTLASGPGGLRAGPFPVKLRTALAPNQAELATVRLDDRLPRGPWHAHLVLNSGRIHREATATIRFPSLATTKPIAKAVGHDHLILVVGTLLLVLLAAVAALPLSRRESFANDRRGSVGARE
jgi:hypothetical protein